MEVEKPKVLLPWIEKYRPNQISEISHQEEVTKSLQGILNTGNMPHMLLYGPPGTGKTSSILALAKQLYGTDFYRQRILELNASDERGIQVVREKIKKFAQSMVSKNPDKNFICPNYKIIILDEADSMTTDAQSALRRIIEDNSQTTRFCIICNYITKIIEPLGSRCVKFRFQPISLESQILKLNSIGLKEGIDIQENALERLIQISNGDMRKSVNFLQMASQLYNKKITVQSVEEISGIVPDTLINSMILSILQKNQQEVIKDVKEVLNQGYSPELIISQMADQIYKNPNFNEINKSRILEKIAIADKALNEGADNELQLLSLMVDCYSILHSNK